MVKRDQDSHSNVSEIGTVEGYDGKISNVTLTQCGTECTIGENCRAFAYKPFSSTCYLSKTNILGEPVNSAYVKEYSKLDRRCNKISPIADENFVDDRALTKNSVYVCSDGENNLGNEFQYANLGSSSLQTGGFSGAVAGRGVPTKVADVANTNPPLAVNYDLYKIKYIDPKTDPLKDLTPNFPKLVKRTDAEIRRLQETTGKYGVRDREYELTVEEDSSARSAFIESDKEYLGQYMLAHQCVVNVPLYDCIKFCANRQKCAGVEWNEAVIKSEGEDNYVYENVCCPKQVIKQIIPRRKQNLRGKFYVKTDIDKIKGRDSIVLTRQDLQNKYGISDIASTIQDSPRFSLQIGDVKQERDEYSGREQDISKVQPNTEVLLPGDLDRLNFS